MVSDETVKAIAVELGKAYLMAGRHAPENTISVVASAIADAVPAITADNAHAVFRRALQVEAIPTVPTLVTAAKNHMAETYSEASGTPSIEYRDPREAWLPKNPVMRAINRTEAVKNYCIACGGNAYWRLCDAKARGMETYGAFMAQVMAVVARLYSKYWRSCPIANGYPANADVTLELIPATVDDFRNMFAMENAGHV